MRLPYARTLVLPSILLALALPAASQEMVNRAPQQGTGSIFMTDVAGQPADVFRSTFLAYLSVGPAAGSPCSGEGLADGAYYFQVTNPSGSVLFSRDSIACRRIEVVGG